MRLSEYLKLFCPRCVDGLYDQKAQKNHNASYVLASIDPDVVYAVMRTGNYGIDRKVRALGTIAGDPKCFEHLKIMGAHMNTNARATEAEIIRLYRLGRSLTFRVHVNDCSIAKARARKIMRKEMDGVALYTFAPVRKRYNRGPFYPFLTDREAERRLMLAIRTGE